MNPTKEDIIEPKNKLGRDPKDFECVIKYQDKTIAFFTMGDYSCYLLKAFEKYDKKLCDILICACNDHFKRPYQRIKIYPNLPIDKKLSANYEQVNFDIANNFDRDKIIKEL